MALDATTNLAIAELVLYVLVFPLLVYSIFKHGGKGFIGWAFLIVFCILRITYDGLQISNYQKQEKGESISDTADILNQIGLSALLLADSGIIHEASHYTRDYNRMHAIIIQVLIHILTTGGIALAAIGGSNLAKPETSSNKYSRDNAIREFGSVVLFLVAAGMVVYAVATHRRLQRDSRGRNAIRLAIATVGAAGFTMARGVYSLIYAFDRSASVNPATGDFGLRFTLIFLVQLLATLCLVGGGVLSRHIKMEGERIEAPITRRADGEGNWDGLILGEVGRDAQSHFKEQGQGFA